MTTPVEMHEEKTHVVLLRDNWRSLAMDILRLILLINAIIWTKLMAADNTLTLFDVTYRLDILVFYMLGFIYALTSNLICVHIRELLTLVSRSVIMRFPRMKGDFSRGTMICRDLVQVILLTLIYYPLSVILLNITFMGFHVIQLLSVTFLLLTLLFVYDILRNLLEQAGTHAVSVFGLERKGLA